MSIVNINISTTSAPKPSQLLKSGVIVSVGGTNLAAGDGKWVSSETAAAAVIMPKMNIGSISWADNMVTVSLNEGVPQGFGSQENIIISGAKPDAYNGKFTGTINREEGTITYPLFTDPGASTVNGQLESAAANELNQMVSSFFAQGKTRSAYILELGSVETSNAVTVLKDFISVDVEQGFIHQQYFAYLVPRSFASSTPFITLCKNYTSESDLVYFFVTGNLDNYTNWAAEDPKSVFFVIESPNKPESEFSASKPFQSFLANDPSASSMVPPMSYRFMYGATVYPAAGNGDLFRYFAEESINYIGTAAEGGISNAILMNGHMLDGKPANYWYAVAWSAINLALNLANEIINGSNSTVNPLYYDQGGIDRLQKRSLQTLRSGVSYGLLLGQVLGTGLAQDEFINELNKGSYDGQLVINAISFTDYMKVSPNDFSQGVYKGLSAVVTPRNGFESITFNLNVTNFVGA